MAWKEWQEGATTEVLYGAHLNGNFDYLSTALAAGITAGNLAAGCVGATAVAADVLGESHMAWADTVNSPKVLQVGKEANTYQQWLVRDTIAVATSTLSYSVVTITYAGAGVCTADEPVFAVAPHVIPMVYTADTTIRCVVSAAGTATAAICVIREGGALSTAQVLHYVVIGDV